MNDKLNRILTLILGVLVGIVVGVTIMNKKDANPAMQELMRQQTESLVAIKDLRKNMSGMPAEGMAEEGTSLGAVLLTQQDLQKRVTAIETKLDSLFKGLGGQAQRPQRQAPPSEDYTKVYKIDVAHSPVRGPKDAPITIVEFVDLQCPFCARFHQPIVDVLKEYPSDVKYILKNFPLSFHPQALPASKAAFAAGEQGKYWEMADLILENNSSLSPDKFKEFAKQLGLNVDKFTKDLEKNGEKWQEWIKQDMQLGSKVDVRGTPTFFLNGKKTRARSLAQFKAEIDKILKEKK